MLFKVIYILIAGSKGLGNLLEMDVSCADNEDWLVIDEAIEQIVIEIEADPVQVSSFTCDICTDSFSTVRGLNIHTSRKHATERGHQNQECVLNDDVLQGYWKEAAQIAQAYTFVDPVDMPLEDDICKRIMEGFNSSTTIPSFVSGFVTIFHDERINKETRAVLTEVLPMLTNKKKQLHQQNQDIPPTTLTAVETNVCFYIGGRVIRTLFYKTGDLLFRRLSEEHTVNEKRLWNLTEISKQIFHTTECNIKAHFLKQPKDLDPALISEEVIDSLKGMILNWLEEVEMSLPEAMKRISEMIKKYARTRGHSYACRITKLFEKKKFMDKKQHGKGKGQRTSLRNNLNST